MDTTAICHCQILGQYSLPYWEIGSYFVKHWLISQAVVAMTDQNAVVTSATVALTVTVSMACDTAFATATKLATTLDLKVMV